MLFHKPSLTIALDAIADSLLPVPCPICLQPRPLGEPICDDCLASVAPTTFTLACGLPVTSLFTYEGRVADAITAAKYQHQPWRARALGLLLGRTLQTGRAPEPGTTLVPVALSRSRALERGYNQAGVIARAAARPARLGHAPCLLRRLDDLESQTRASRTERLSRPLSFTAGPWEGPLMIVDDVLTTGATIGSCAAALRRSATGPGMLSAWTIAWTP